MSPPAARAARGPGLTGPRVALLARHGKFLVAEPFFGPGPRLAVSRDKRAAVGDLVLVHQEPGRGNRGAGAGPRWPGGWADPTWPVTSSRP